METTPIGFCHREQIESIREKYGHASASHAFATLFIWQKEMKMSLYLEEDMFAVRLGGFGENTWLFPCGDANRICSFIKAQKDRPGFRLCYLRQEDKALLETHFPGEFIIEERPENHEYLYDRTEQTNLSGKRFNQIRNHINRVKKDHQLTTVTFDDTYREEAAKIILTWEERKAEDAPGKATDAEAVMLLLKYARELKVLGVMIYVDGEPYAMVAGFALSPTCFDICLAKQKDYLSGLSVYAKHEFILFLPEQYQTLNAEEDLGIEGLRTMKRQMKPCGMIEMFEARQGI